MNILFPTTSSNFYQVDASCFEPKSSNTQVTVDLDETAEMLFGEDGYKYQENTVCQFAGHAAYNSFNKLDKAYKMSGGIIVTQSFGSSSGNLVIGSDSSGLAYSLSLFHAWWHGNDKIFQNKPPLNWTDIIATGAVDKNRKLITCKWE